MSDLNVTMVAFHGKEKPDDLQQLLGDIIGLLAANLPPSFAWAFKNYEFAQIHATVIGMEADVVNGRLFSRWFRRNKAQECAIEVDKLRQVLKNFIEGRRRLFSIRFGGFPEGYCTCKADQQPLDGWNCPSNPLTFHSCDRSAYEGSFYAFSPGPALITGWPVQGPADIETYPHCLYEFRRALEEAGLSDKFHSNKNPHWRDDDFYIRVGTFTWPLRAGQLGAIQKIIRDYLSKRKPATIDVMVDDVSIILYDDPSLEEKHIRQQVPLADFLKDPSTVKRLYDVILAAKTPPHVTA